MKSGGFGWVGGWGGWVGEWGVRGGDSSAAASGNKDRTNVGNLRHDGSAGKRGLLSAVHGKLVTILLATTESDEEREKGLFCCKRVESREKNRVTLHRYRYNQPLQGKRCGAIM